MARIHPDVEKSKVIFHSKAEEEVYDMARQLSDEWSVYFSCTLTASENENGIVDNETLGMTGFFRNIFKIFTFYKQSNL